MIRKGDVVELHYPHRRDFDNMLGVVDRVFDEERAQITWITSPKGKTTDGSTERFVDLIRIGNIRETK